MATIMNAVSGGGNTLLDVTTDGTFFTPQGSADYLGVTKDGYMYVEFFDGSFQPVQPTGGTVSHAMSVSTNQFLEGYPSGAIDANQCGPEASYTPPRFQGLGVRGRVTFNGITGAQYAIVQFVRY